MKQKVMYSSDVVNFLVALIIIMTFVGIWAGREGMKPHPEIPYQPETDSQVGY